MPDAEATRSTIGRRFGLTGAALLAGLVIVAVAAPVLAPYDPSDLVGASLARPGGGHLLGTNDLGQDIFSELVYGTRTSLGIAAVVAFLATTAGALVGLVAGFLRGPVDAVLMRVVDVVLVIPLIPLLIVLQVFLGAGAGTLAGVLSAVLWARPARELRSQVLSVRHREHVQAAVAMGGGTGYVLVRHVLPEVAPLLVPQVVRIARSAVLLEASLSFLGLGDPTVASWGTMLYHAQARSAYLTGAWLWWIVPPGVAIGITVLGVALVGYALEEATRPRLSGAWAPAPGGRGRSREGRAAGPGPAPVGEPRGGDHGTPLELDGVRIEYGPGLEAVRGADLVVGPAEIVGLVGASGSGKTTLATAALALLRAPGRLVGGRVRVGGHDLAGLPEPARRALRGRAIALVPQNALNALNPVRRVLAQVEEALRAHGTVAPAEAGVRARELLRAVSFPDGRERAYPHELSGGMRQRVLLAIALANDPDVLVADEPTTGLDAGTRDAVLELLLRLRRERGLAILLITHDLAVVRRVADRIAVMHDGRIVEVAPRSRLEAEPRHPETRRLLAGTLTALSSTRARHAPTPSPVLEVEAVVKAFARGGGGSRRVLDGVDLTVGGGEIVGLLGESGVGKTTLARIVLGLERADAGRVRFEGRDVTRLGATERRRLARSMHLVFQDPYSSLPEHLRVAAIVAEPLRIHRIGSGEERRRRALEALERVGLRASFAERLPHELSGGERQRVALARAIVTAPALVVADEPASLLDPPLRAEIAELLAAVRDREGIAVLYVTHDAELAAALCDRSVVLEGGRSRAAELEGSV